jgi:hypothetical protein
MNEIRMTTDIRTDYDCEASGLPAEHWAEAVFSVDGHEIVLEVSAEKDIIVAIMVDEQTTWKGTLKGLTKLLSEAVRPPSA